MTRSGEVILLDREIRIHRTLRFAFRRYQMAQMDDLKRFSLGEILVQEQVLETDELDELLEIQKRDSKPLGQLSVDRGFLSQHGLKLILKKYHKRMRLGEVLLTMGLVGTHQLDEALRSMEHSKKRLGECLIEMGVLSEDEIVTALSEQLDIPRVIPDFNLIDLKLLKGVNYRFLSAHQALPAFKNPDGAITVIMNDPLNEETLRDLENFFKCPILPAMATTAEIAEALRGIHQGNTLEELPQRTDLEFITPKDLMIEETQPTDNENRTVAVVNYLISRGASDGASDIHIEPQPDRIRVRYRIDGVMHTKTDLPKDLGPPIASRIKALCGLNITERRRHQDGRIEAKIHARDYDIRIATYPSLYGENVVLRLLQRLSFLVSLEQLGFSPLTLHQYMRLLDAPAGVILVTGPTGSGKSTTLYSSLTYLGNREFSIITIEDPVEYTIEGVVQASYDPKLGLSHGNYIKAMMRQDPDVIMIGEIRDIETAQTAIQVSLTGHKVFSTFHSDDSPGALLRLLHMGIEPYLVGSAIGAIVSQRLIRVICRYCKEEYVPDPKVLEALGIRSNEASSHQFYRGHGCNRCRQTGFKGRSGIHELLFVNDQICEAILSRKTSSEIRQIARSQPRFVSLREDAIYKAMKGVTSLEEVNRVIFHREDEKETPRALDDLLRLCSNKDTEIDPRAPAPAGTIDKPRGQKAIFRTTIRCDNLDEERDKLVALFKRHRSASEANGGLGFDEFSTKLIQNIQFHRVNGQNGSVDISVRTKAGDGRIFIEGPSAQSIEITPRR